jgi:hypothetical protein
MFCKLLTQFFCLLTPLFLICCCSYEQLRKMTTDKTVVVLPAFETAPQKNMTLAHELADTAALMTKDQLGRLVNKKLIYQFALYLFRQVCSAGQSHQQQQRLIGRAWHEMLRHIQHGNNSGSSCGWIGRVVSTWSGQPAAQQVVGSPLWL